MSPGLLFVRQSTKTRARVALNFNFCGVGPITMALTCTEFEPHQFHTQTDAACVKDLTKGINIDRIEEIKPDSSIEVTVCWQWLRQVSVFVVTRRNDRKICG